MKLLLIIFAYLLSTFMTTAEISYSFENFNSGQFADSIFGADGFHNAFHCDPLYSSYNAPNTLPALPCNVGGDQEGRSVNYGYAFTDSLSTSYPGQIIDGYIGFGVVTQYGGKSTGFMLRSGHDESILSVYGYIAYVNYYFGSSFSFVLSRIGNGIGSQLSAMSIHNADFMNENYRIRFVALYDMLTAEIWRVTVEGEDTV